MYKVWQKVWDNWDECEKSFKHQEGFHQKVSNTIVTGVTKTFHRRQVWTNMSKMHIKIGLVTTVTYVKKAILLSLIYTIITKVCTKVIDTIVKNVREAFQRSNIWTFISKVYMRMFDTIVISVTKALIKSHIWKHI